MTTETATLTGAVERVTFYNPETGYSVIRLRPETRTPIPGMGRDGLITLVGSLPELTPGEHVRITGRWLNHPQHGLQLQAETCQQTMPATVAGIRRYLGSGLIKGIGARLAERIVDRFGAQTLEIIETAPHRLAEVPDIGRKRTAQIITAWREQKQIKTIMLFLHSHGISTNLAVKIYKHYGDQAINTVQNDPYQLARDITGIGFKTADTIAQSLGLAADHPSRLEAGILYALNQITDDGNVYAPQAQLLQTAAELLGQDVDKLPPALERLRQQDRVRLEVVPPPQENARGLAGIREPLGQYGVPAVYLTPLYHSETGAAERLNGLAYTLFSRLTDIPPDFIPLAASLTVEQQQAVRAVFGHPVSIITGGPGTGKTTCLKALIGILEAHHKTYALCAPTGRAAKRLSEATERPAKTIHRLLAYSPQEGFTHNHQNPLPADLIVVDEASMLDITLANHLLKALPQGAHLLLVGDVDQLPSVGAGNVLNDIIASGAAHVTRLTVIFRQSADSHIITNAHRINHGQMPIFSTSKSTGDFFLFPTEEPEEAANWVEDVVCSRIPQQFGFNPQRDVQVLAPMYRGLAGVHALNQRLQARLNPPDAQKPQKTLFGQIFRIGDKVMQTQNDYDKEVYNGDIGWITALDPIEHSLTVTIDNRPVVYDWKETDALVLAYAVSVHKSQGAEFPVVVLPLLTQHYLMLQRNLLYTAVTRAKKLCVLIGSRRAIGIAINNNKVSLRYSALEWRLRK